MTQCRSCRHVWHVPLSRETWERLQDWDRGAVGNALAAGAVRWDRLSCGDRQSLRICREVMET